MLSVCIVILNINDNGDIAYNQSWSVLHGKVLQIQIHCRRVSIKIN